jgi:hypothetical protein
MVEPRKTFPCQSPTVPKIAFDIAPDRELWDRQIGETAKQYAAFLAYRDLGLSARSIPATARVLGLSPRTGQVGAWSARNHWRERVDAWDGELERRKQVALTDEIQEMARRHVAAAQDYIEALMEPAREMARRLMDPQFESLGELPTADLLILAARCASVLPKLFEAERLARGQPTALAERRGPVRDYSPDVFQRIDQYTAVFERVLRQRAETAAR